MQIIIQISCGWKIVVVLESGAENAVLFLSFVLILSQTNDDDSYIIYIFCIMYITYKSAFDLSSHRTDFHFQTKFPSGVLLHEIWLTGAKKTCNTNYTRKKSYSKDLQ